MSSSPVRLGLGKLSMKFGGKKTAARLLTNQFWGLGSVDQRAKTSAIQARSRKLSVCNALWLFSQVVQRSMYSGLVLSELFSTCFSVQQNLPEANWLAAFSALLQTDPLSSQLVSLCNETWTFLLCGLQQTPLMRILCLVATSASLFLQVFLGSFLNSFKAWVKVSDWA